MLYIFFLTDPNTQILYACDSCGDKFLDASSLAQHVRIHTAQALVMFQADSDFYQYATTGEGDAAASWQPTSEQVIHEGQVIIRAEEEERKPEDGIVGETQEPQGTEEIIHVVEEVAEGNHSEHQTEGEDVEGEKKEDMDC